MNPSSFVMCFSPVRLPRSVDLLVSMLGLGWQLPWNWTRYILAGHFEPFRHTTSPVSRSGRTLGGMDRPVHVPATFSPLACLEPLRREVHRDEADHEERDDHGPLHFRLEYSAHSSAPSTWRVSPRSTKR